MGAAPDQSEAEAQVEIWKIKKLIKSLEAARGNGTSMISLVIPPKDQVTRINKMLGDEYGTGKFVARRFGSDARRRRSDLAILSSPSLPASNIKSRVNRLSVLGAITSAQQRLKLYNKVPPNGLVIYCGTVITDEGKEKKLNIDFEPFKVSASRKPRRASVPHGHTHPVLTTFFRDEKTQPINTSLYLCDNKFHTEALAELLQSDQRYGFIVMDGNGSLFGTLSGNHREILHKVSGGLSSSNSGDAAEGLG